MAVSSVFLLGGFVTICSIVRLVFLVQAQDHLDFTWGLAQPALWFTVELHIGVVCACLPFTWPLTKLFCDRRRPPASSSRFWPGNSKEESFSTKGNSFTQPTDLRSLYRHSESLGTDYLFGSLQRLTLGSQFRRENNAPLSPFEEPGMPDVKSAMLARMALVDSVDGDSRRPSLPEKDEKWAGGLSPMPPLPAVDRYE